ncbi:MAG: hypothetical protein H6711_09760 [Myxococcales bacterium]|nr:hypothetical protein [Myxococcales bacterium]
MRGSITSAGILAALLVACQTPCEERPGALCAVVGSGELGFNRDGLTPAETDLFLVSAARRGPDGRLYIMDFNNQRLRRIGDDGLVETIVGDGFHAIAATGVPILETPLENPIDFGFLADGRIVFVSYHDPRILEIGDDGTLHALAGGDEGLVAVSGDEGDGGPAEDALFIQLDGIAVAGDGAIFVSDSLANRVRVIRDGIITTVAGTGEAAYSGDGGSASAAALRWPTALALEPGGGLLIADALNHAIRRVDAEGVITTIAGDGIEGFAGDGGPASASRLSQPFGVAVDDDGTIYVADRGNFRIRRIDPEGIITTIAGVGVEGASGDDGPAIEAQLGYVARIALDGESLLVADQSNSRIRRLVLR